MKNRAEEALSDAGHPGCTIPGMAPRQSPAMAPETRSPGILTRRESPYARFQLFRNPFGELTREERAELAVVEVARWLAHLRDSSTALQFLGPSGHGKSTHLLALERRLPQACYVYLPADPPRPRVPRTRPLLLDEAQRLSWRQQREVFRAGGPLALGTHEDLGVSLRQEGFQVVTIDVAAAMTAERLEQLLNRRIMASRIPGPLTVPRIELSLALTLLRDFGPDVRRIEQHLYEQFQDAVQRGTTWPPAT